MDSFNKVISFVLGLVVVLVFFAVVTGKINLKSKTSPTSPVQKNSGGFFGFFKPNITLTPTPTFVPSSITINTNTGENNIYKQNNQASQYSNVKSIPSTGLPTLFIPILFSGLAGGSLLRKVGKNKFN